MAKYYGWNAPFWGGHQNVMSRQADERLIKNDVLQLLLTSKGERVMRPNWGTILKRSVFEQIDDTQIRAIINDIKEQLRLEDPRVSCDVTVTKNEDENLINVLVSGVYTNQLNRQFEIEINLPFQGA